MIGTIDRIEGKHAIILVRTSDLPKGIKEGSLLDLTIKLSDTQTQKRKTKVRKALSALFGKK